MGGDRVMSVRSDHVMSVRGGGEIEFSKMRSYQLFRSEAFAR